MPTQLIVALDFADAETALAFVKPLNPADCILKVGLELYVATGPGLVKQLVRNGFRVFLDLKFHDIPNTVAGACRSAAELGVWMLNVHAGGGESMLLAARDAIEQAAHKPLLIGVTVLTSMNDQQLNTVGVHKAAKEQVLSLAALSEQCGLDGVVCSAQESERIHNQCGEGFVCVTPGIRPAGASVDDQSRIMTPAAAARAGSDFIVVGRPITQSADPLQMINAINQELSDA